MDAKELMIGDWVQTKEVRSNGGCLPSFKRQVAQIKDCGAELSFTDRYGNKCYNTLSYDNIEPIPLTRQILKANWCYEGVELSIRYKEGEGGYLISENRRENGTNVFELVAMYYDEEFSDYYSVPNSEIELRYVHELQHALRLCGIEKEIEL